MNEKWSSIVDMASFESKKKKKETEREREKKKDQILDKLGLLRDSRSPFLER